MWHKHSQGQGSQDHGVRACLVLTFLLFFGALGLLLGAAASAGAVGHGEVVNVTVALLVLSALHTAHQERALKAA